MDAVTTPEQHWYLPPGCLNCDLEILHAATAFGTYLAAVSRSQCGCGIEVRNLESALASAVSALASAAKKNQILMLIRTRGSLCNLGSQLLI